MDLLSRLNKKYLLGPKALYVAISMQYYTLHKFRPLFAKEMFGIGESELGAMGILLFVTFFTNILLATMNDKFGRPKIFMVALLSLSCIFFQLFYIERYFKGVRSMFWINLFAYLGTNTPIMALLDKIVLDYLNKFSDENTKAYGKQRIWGTAGYLISIFALEGIIRTTNSKSGIDFSGLRYYSLATTIIAVILVATLLEDSKSECRGPSYNIMSEWKELLRNREYLFFILIIFLNGFTRAAMTLYLPIYVKYVLKVKPYILPASWPAWVRSSLWALNNFPFGTITMFEISLEIGILFYFDIVSKKTGLLWPLLLSQISQTIRFVLYLILPPTNPHVFAFCCMFEIFKGINFGLSHGAGVQLAEKLCPPHLKATSQMIYNGAFTAISSVTAGLYFRYVFRNNETLDPEEIIARRIESFRIFFMSNILVTTISIFLFLIKYGVRDKKPLNVLFFCRRISQKA
ncbi:putative nucleoside transporter [Encephalitozoon intestinalis ATCC 50506]|uniref:Nucleoside transporter n=1 Tax=Encephalitozoon intestinalis (strain ATCC 50506) TaxID=876142 RepID=E0SA55_ENCIT|nr:putative nucleoside transporter [Encephalitozoon intestinalis ATCC 50506]ADM12677.1 putative nucleoside transporter [Encephalitozoon intestinalis ATCC 50506]UTX46538.1 lactose-proton symport [Encephalitozoon intestinalis]